MKVDRLFELYDEKRGETPFYEDDKVTLSVYVSHYDPVKGFYNDVYLLWSKTITLGNGGGVFDVLLHYPGDD